MNDMDLCTVDLTLEIKEYQEVWLPAHGHVTEVRPNMDDTNKIDVTFTCTVTGEPERLGLYMIPAVGGQIPIMVHPWMVYRTNYVGAFYTNDTGYSLVELPW